MRLGMTTLNTLLKRIDRFTQHVNHLIDTYVDQTLVTTDIIKAQQTLATLSNLHKERIAEIAMSRFSIYMQAKISTVIRGEANDEDVEQITQDLYNGAPFIKTTKFFDPEESILSINEGQGPIS